MTTATSPRTWTRSRPPWAAEGQLSGLVRDVHRAGLRDPVPAAGAADGARQRRRSDRRWSTDNIAQDYAIQGQIQAFFAWMAKYDSVYHLGTTAAEVSASWYKARDQLEAHPSL